MVVGYIELDIVDRASFWWLAQTWMLLHVKECNMRSKLAIDRNAAAGSSQLLSN